MSKINANTEWGTLKEVILGRAEWAQVPRIKNKDIHCVDYANIDDLSNMPGGQYPEDVINETIEDLDVFQKQLEDIGVKVMRPIKFNHGVTHMSPDWSSDAYYSYCPRDSVLTIGDMLIETPMPLRSRYFETFGMRSIFKEYFVNGSRWIAAPKPRLPDKLYDRSDLNAPTLTEYEPAFDAANCVKIGKDILYLVSNSGNKMGARWLQSTLGEKYTVHMLENVYAYVHLDTSIMPLAPGKVLLNPERVKEEQLPNIFDKWEKIWAPIPQETQVMHDWAPASPWLGMNILSLSESLVAVEENQINLTKTLEDAGFDVMHVKMRHCRTLSGGPHCVTLDTVREDEYADYR